MSFSIGGSCVGAGNYGTPSSVNRTDVATGDLIVIAVSARRTGGANTISVTGGTGDTVVAGTANVQGVCTLQFFYILSAVATGTVTYSATSASAEEIRINVWRATSTGTIVLDTQQANEQGVSGYQGITTGDFTTAGGIVFFAINPQNTNITEANTTINAVAPGGQFTNAMNRLTLGYSIQAGFTEDLYFYLPGYTDWLANILAFTEAAGGSQFARPNRDAAAGGWTPSTGNDLWAMIDEVTPSDADYIQSG